MKNSYFSWLKFGGRGMVIVRSPNAIYSVFSWLGEAAALGPGEHHLKTTNLDVWILKLVGAGKEEKVDAVSTDSFFITWADHAQINFISPITHFDCRRRRQEYSAAILKYSSNMCSFQVFNSLLLRRFTWKGRVEKQSSCLCTSCLNGHNKLAVFTYA